MADEEIPTPATPAMPIANKVASNDQIWERAKADTEKFIADAAVCIMGGQNTALVADQFAGMAVRSHPAHVATMMATLLVMTALDRLKEKGLLPEMPPDPFATPDAENAPIRELVEAFVNELTGLTLRHGMAVDTHGQAVSAVETHGPHAGQMVVALANHLVWSPELGRYVCESPEGAEDQWRVP